ncbi:Stk1 family PASTA domain-containing Ser/Thr kinase [Alkalihalobacillus trypoxylicola]|uniref:Serine/threonine-protein kinase PrkC n=1 Tax=Alkalihalobacillus trypoxylicola TaxID=519424 RepID=A0A161PLR5_9BACI|nr:Stk1 family PASTA domain-containing Ser/Thr kinase [Alkalihalobacillus trypoxylicola]KYG35336.1 serine/threonine protein kinase [Alkalihalobacillus trypoxylicola]
MIGQRINGRYEVKEIIGGGGMANVYQALDVILDRYVAVKVLQPQFSSDEQFIKRFRREAQAATSLAHENIVNIYDVGEEGDTYYIVMEYVKGQTLKELIQNVGPLPNEQAVEIMEQILSAISHAHDNHIVHRDIKPHNILIREDGVAKVADFGIARAMSAATITHTNSVMGSVHYLSPEQARGGHVTYKSDIYSLGIVLYEMVTGLLPFSGDTAVSIAIKHLQNDMPSAKAVNSNVPQSLENIIKKATIKDPLRRYESSHSMQQDLETSLNAERLNEAPYLFHESDDEVTKAIPIITSISHEEDLHKTIEVNPKTNDTGKDQKLDKLYDSKADDKNHKPKKKKKKKWLLILGIILFLIVAAGITTFALMPNLFKVDEVEVPDLVGELYETAEEELTGRNLVVIRQETSVEDAENEEVVRQIPQPGSMIKENAEVTLFVNVGEEEIVIDDYVDRTYESARRILTEMGFEVIPDPQESTDTPAGIVTSQSPEPGETVSADDKVITLTYSVDSRVRLDQLIGMSKGEVEDYFEEVELVADFSEEHSNSVEQGYVIRHSPDAYTTLYPGETVRVTISLGPEPIIEEPVEDEPPSQGEEEELQTYPLRLQYNIPDDYEGEVEIRIVYRDVSTNGQEEVLIEEKITSSKEYRLELLVSEEQPGSFETYVNGELDENLSGAYQFGSQ